MKKIRWVQISLSSLLAAQVGCSFDDIEEKPTAQQSTELRAHFENEFDAAFALKKIDLTALPKAIDGRARCACQQRTGN